MIYIDLVLKMGLMKSSKYFYNFSEILVDITSLPVPLYGSITNNLKTGTCLPHTPDIITHIECYIDDIIMYVKYALGHQKQVFNGPPQALKWLFPLLPQKPRIRSVSRRSSPGKVTGTSPKKTHIQICTHNQVNDPF